MPSPEYTWDFFIAHAGADTRAAEEIYDYLKPQSRVFLDSRCLKPGDDWPTKLAEAQQESLVTVVLISSKADAAYYQKEEIAAAIQLSREDASRHRVVPVFLDSETGQPKIPYGLRVKHSLTVSPDLPLKAVAEKLLDLLKESSDESRGSTLPNQPYFFGREKELAIILDALAPESRSWGALIDGPGGIGKTSLAIRAGHLTPAEDFSLKFFLSAPSRVRQARRCGGRVERVRGKRMNYPEVNA